MSVNVFQHPRRRSNRFGEVLILVKKPVERNSPAEAEELVMHRQFHSFSTQLQTSTRVIGLD